MCDKVIENMDRTNNHVEADHIRVQVDLQMDHPPGLRKTRFFEKNKNNPTVFIGLS